MIKMAFKKEVEESRKTMNWATIHNTLNVLLYKCFTNPTSQKQLFTKSFSGKMYYYLATTSF